MAQSRERRNLRAKRRQAPRASSPLRDGRRTRLRRIVIAFLVLVGLAGILALQAPGDDPDGAPHPSVRTDAVVHHR